MKHIAYIIIIFFFIPLSLFSQDEFSYFKSLCDFRKEKKIKTIFISVFPPVDAYEDYSFDENGFPVEINFMDYNNNGYRVENISVSEQGLLSYTYIKIRDSIKDTSYLKNTLPSFFIENWFGDNSGYNIRYKFDSRNRLIEIITTDEDKNSLSSKILYDEHNRILFKKYFDSKSNLTSTAFYKYNSDNLLKQILYTNYGSIYYGEINEIEYFDYTFY